MPGRLIALIGPSSVGKTTVAAELQEQLSEPYLVVGLDHFFMMFPHHWKDHPREPGYPGFWYEQSTDPDGSPRTRIRYGAAGARMLAGMRAAVNALLEQGNDVILDEMPLDETIVPAWQRELRAERVFWVHLTATLAQLEAREAGRTRGQVVGNSRGHLGNGADEPYDLIVNTDGRTPADIASEILRRCPF